jgi:hypothetical protein
MPHYFFNFETNGSSIRDLIGRDLPDDEAAKDEAVKLAAELGLDGAVKGELPHFEWVEVRDEQERAVARLPIADVARGPNRMS